MHFSFNEIALKWRFSNGNVQLTWTRPISSDSEVSYGKSNTSKGESPVACVDSTAQQIASTGSGVDGIKEYSKGQGTLGLVGIDSEGHEHVQATRPVGKGNNDCLHVDPMHDDLV